MMAITSKTGLAAGVDPTILRRYVQDGLILFGAPPPRPPPPPAAAAATSAVSPPPRGETGAAAEAVGGAEVVVGGAAGVEIEEEEGVPREVEEEQLGPEAKAEVKRAIMLVSFGDVSFRCVVRIFGVLRAVI